MALYDEDRFQLAVVVVIFLSVFFLWNRYCAAAYKLNMIRQSPQRAEMLFGYTIAIGLVHCGMWGGKRPTVRMAEGLGQRNTPNQHAHGTSQPGASCQGPAAKGQVPGARCDEPSATHPQPAAKRRGQGAVGRAG